MILFFGDSLTSGENNNFQGFVEKLNDDSCWNAGVSGTCIGDYSLYPVGATNLMQQLYKSYIQKIPTIVLEYGSNDVSSVAAGYVTLNQVKIDLIKAIDYIKQNNPEANIYFILLGENKSQMAKAQCDYLNNEYLKALSSKVYYHRWIDIYNEFEEFIKTLLPVIYLPKLNADDIDLDGIHPNDQGYQKISNKIKESLCLY